MPWPLLRTEAKGADPQLRTVPGGTDAASGGGGRSWEAIAQNACRPECLGCLRGYASDPVALGSRPEPIN